MTLFILNDEIFQDFTALWDSALLVLKLKNAEMRLIPKYLMPLFFASPGHQQQWHWIFRIKKPLPSMSKGFNYLHHFNVKKYQKVQIYFFMFLQNYSALQGVKYVTSPAVMFCVYWMPGWSALLGITSGPIGFCYSLGWALCHCWLLSNI